MKFFLLKDCFFKHLNDERFKFKNENRVLLLFERVGQVLVTCTVPCRDFSYNVELNYV